MNVFNQCLSRSFCTQIFFSFLFVAFLTLGASAQTVQITQASVGDENHYSITRPANLEDDFLVVGTHRFSSAAWGSFGRYARQKRVKPDGELFWDHYMMADEMENRAMHVISSDWGGGVGTVFGFMDEGSPEALIYGLNDMGDVVNPSKLINAAAGTEDATTFLSGIACSDGGWLAVGEWKNGSDRSGLAVKFTMAGAIEWSVHIDAPTPTPGVDYDALNHVLEIENGGYFIGGSGNFVDPSGNTQQGALAGMLTLDGVMTWGRTYVHSDFTYESVAATAVQTGSGKLYQIVNGNLDPNGFSVHQIDLTNGGLSDPDGRNLYIQEHPMKVMSARPHPTNPNHFVVGGFLEVDMNDIGYQPNDPPMYGIMAGDRAPFLMEINPTTGVSLPFMQWHQVYDVPSTSFGFSGALDRYNVFSNSNTQPQIFHPEMLWSNTAEEYHLIGYREDSSAPSEFNLEFIAANNSGDTECPTYQANILEVMKTTAQNFQVFFSPKDYDIIPFEAEIFDYPNVVIPCDACFPDVSVTEVSVTCDGITLTVTPFDDDPANVCYDVDWGDGTSTSANGAATLSHDWVSDFSSFDVVVSPFCCDIPLLTGINHNITVVAPEGCDCEDCTPLLLVCQVDFEEPTISYPSSGLDFGYEMIYTSIFDCPSGCDEAPYSISASLSNFMGYPFGPNCLDDVSGQWLLDGVVVGGFPCEGYAPITLTVMDEGTHELVVVLTDCADELCSNSMSRTVEVGSCIPPSHPRFQTFDFAILPCPAFKCPRSFSPLQSTCSSMESEWFIDGAFAAPGDISFSNCFDWGWHDVELRYTCPESGLTNSAVEELYCGPVISTIPEVLLSSSEWLPAYFSIDAVVGEDCGLEITGPWPNDPTSTFNPFQPIAITLPIDSVDVPAMNSTMTAGAFEWAIRTMSTEGEVVSTYYQTENGATSSWDGSIRTSSNVEEIGQVCFELTGPDWLVANSSEAIEFCIDVDDCELPFTCDADLNGDAFVTVIDLLLVLEDFGTACN